MKSVHAGVSGGSDIAPPASSTEAEMLPAQAAIVKQHSSNLTVCGERAHCWARQHGRSAAPAHLGPDAQMGV